MNQIVTPHNTINEQLNAFDITLVCFFMLLFLVVPKLVALRMKRRSVIKQEKCEQSSQGRSNQANRFDQEFLLMSKNLSLPLMVATLTSTWYGGIFGVTQIAFEHGIYGFFTQGLFWYVSYFAFAIFLAKKIRQKQVLSLPELIGQRFGKTARKLAAIILFFHALPITYALSVGLLLKMALGLDFFWSLILGVSIVAIYTSVGGFRSVVITDCLQFVLMFFAVIMVILVCYLQFGGISFLAAALPSHYFEWRGENQISSALIWLFIACTSTFIHPVFYQRCLAARSDRVAILGIFIAMGFWLLFDLCTTLGGMYAKAMLPTADSALAYLILGVSILPHGLKGLFLTGMLATILSTLDSFMFVSGTSISYDLIGPQSILGHHAHKVAVLFCGVLIITIGSIFGSDFEATWLFMEGAFSTSMVAPVLAAFFLKRRFSDSNFVIPALGALLSYFWSFYLHRLGMITIEPFYVAHATALVLFMVVLQLNTQRYPKVTNFADS